MQNLLLSCAIFTAILSATPVGASNFKVERDGFYFSFEMPERPSLEGPQKRVKDLDVAASPRFGGPAVDYKFIRQKTLHLGSARIEDKVEEDEGRRSKVSLSVKVKDKDKDEVRGHPVFRYLVDKGILKERETGVDSRGRGGWTRYLFDLCVPYEPLSVEQKKYEETNETETDKDGKVWIKEVLKDRYRRFDGTSYESQVASRYSRVEREFFSMTGTLCEDYKDNRNCLEKLLGKRGAVKEHLHMILEGKIVGVEEVTYIKTLLDGPVIETEERQAKPSFLPNLEVEELSKVSSFECPASLGASHSGGCKPYRSEDYKGLLYKEENRQTRPLSKKI